MMVLALAVFAAVALVRLGLSWLNLQHLLREGQTVPEVLAGVVDEERLARISAYTAARARFGMLAGALSTLVLGVFLFGGGLAWYDARVQALVSGFVARGVVFAIGLMLASSLLAIPLQLYSDFRLEARFGFNRKTPALWWSDWAKSTALSLGLSAALAAAALWLVHAAPSSWWLWVSVLVSSVTLLLTFLSPYLIEPLFYRMEPIEAGELGDGIRAMAARGGVDVRRVLKMDASRRSSHSNAYFTGLGREKRVVLFDTLLAQMSADQILAVLAHELGHWKKHHVLFRTLASQVLLFLGAYLAFRLFSSQALPALVGLPDASFAARILLLGVIGSIVLFPLTPLFSAWSRHDEREADRFAVELHGAPRDLADALAKLGTENLSNLHPHPLYAAFYYSHPPLVERIGGLRRLAAAQA